MLLSLLKVAGHSMEPTIQSGSFIIATSVPYLFLYPKVGDIVVVKKNTKNYIKRIQRLRHESYYLEGDNKEDNLKIQWIDRKNIVGKVIYKI